MEEDKFIQTENGLIYGMCAGDPGSALVLSLHGWSQSNGWQTWQPLLQPLAEAGYYVVSVDMPGWGQSPGPGLARRRLRHDFLNYQYQLPKNRAYLFSH